MKNVLLVSSAMLVIAALTQGCSKENGTTGSSQYSVDYKMLTRDKSPDPNYAGFEVTVKGQAADLAVILTDPKGEVSDVQKIEKDQMITNIQTQDVLMRTSQAGTWVLTVKTVNPERVIWQKKIPITKP